MIKKLLFILLYFSWIGSLQAQPEIEAERKKGVAAALEVEQEMGLVHVQSAEVMVKKIGARLVAHLPSSPYTFSFQIVDQEDPNAFALPGGFVYVLS